MLVPNWCPKNYFTQFGWQLHIVHGLTWLKSTLCILKLTCKRLPDATLTSANTTLWKHSCKILPHTLGNPTMWRAVSRVLCKVLVHICKQGVRWVQTWVSTTKKYAVKKYDLQNSKESQKSSTCNGVCYTSNITHKETTVYWQMYTSTGAESWAVMNYG